MNNTRFLYITDVLIPADINTWYFNPVQTWGVFGENRYLIFYFHQLVADYLVRELTR